MAADEGRNIDTPQHGRNDYVVMTQCQGENRKQGAWWAGVGIAGTSCVNGKEGRLLKGRRDKKWRHQA